MTRMVSISRMIAECSVLILLASGCGDDVEVREANFDLGGGAASGAVESISIASVNSAGAGAIGGNSNQPAVSADGRYVAFSSAATNLVAGDTNGLIDIFVRDTVAGTTIRASVDSGGAEAVGGNSVLAAISGDGRYVAFESPATNLVAGDTNGVGDVFVHDTVAGTTTRVSVDSGGLQGNAISRSPAINGDGRYVAFRSDATNLVAGDTNGQMDIFVRDTVAGTTTRVSVNSGGVEATGGLSQGPAISADGRYVAFYSLAINLVGSDTNAVEDIFVRDTVGGTTTRASVDSGGAQAIGGNSQSPAISSDGRYVSFESSATNLVAGDTNAVSDVFVRDTVAGTTTRVSVDNAGAQAPTGSSSSSSISGDGRYVAFHSSAATLVAGDTNANVDVFVRDTVANTTTRASVSSTGAQAVGAGSTSPKISGDGRYVAFQSSAANLVPGDTNGISDAFRAPAH